MTWLDWSFDLVVALLLLALATRILLSRDLFEAAVLFIAFGLSLSLAWVRLGATDLALAEAALGAGVTGALFLTAFRRLAGGGDEDRKEEGPPPVPGFARSPGGREPFPWIRGGLGALGLLTGVILAGILVRMPERGALLPSLVEARLEETGVANPVTAVLLNFRAYDTLLELVVLLVAMTAVWSLDRGGQELIRDDEELQEDPVLDGLSRSVVPLAGVTSVYLVWIGSHSPGGAFQAGALLAGTGVLVVTAGLLEPVSARERPTRALGLLGVAVFGGVGVAGIPWTGRFLEYPSAVEGGVILLVEGVVAVSIAITLIELFVDVPAVPRPDPSLARVHPTGDPLGRGIALDGGEIRGPEEDDG